MQYDFSHASELSEKKFSLKVPRYKKDGLVPKAMARKMAEALQAGIRFHQ